MGEDDLIFENLQGPPQPGLPLGGQVPRNGPHLPGTGVAHPPEASQHGQERKVVGHDDEGARPLLVHHVDEAGVNEQREDDEAAGDASGGPAVQHGGPDSSDAVERGEVGIADGGVPGLLELVGELAAQEMGERPLERARLALAEQVRHQADHLHADGARVHGGDGGGPAEDGGAGARHAQPRRGRRVGRPLALAVAQLALLEADKGVDAEDAGGEAYGVDVGRREVLDLAAELAHRHVEVGAGVMVEGPGPGAGPRLGAGAVGLFGPVQRRHEEQRVQQRVAPQGQLGHLVCPERERGLVDGDGRARLRQVLVEEGEFEPASGFGLGRVRGAPRVCGLLGRCGRGRRRRR